MNAKKSASVRSLGSDLAKLDAHKVDASQYEELPQLANEMLTRSTVNRGGRPRLASSKVLLSVRYSREVVDFFRATGQGWQSRMDAALKEYVARHSRE